MGAALVVITPSLVPMTDNTRRVLAILVASVATGSARDKTSTPAKNADSESACIILNCLCCSMVSAMFARMCVTLSVSGPCSFSNAVKLAMVLLVLNEAAAAASFMDLKSIDVVLTVAFSFGVAIEPFSQPIGSVP